MHLSRQRGQQATKAAFLAALQNASLGGGPGADAEAGVCLGAGSGAASGAGIGHGPAGARLGEAPGPGTGVGKRRGEALSVGRLGRLAEVCRDVPESAIRQMDQWYRRVMGVGPLEDRLSDFEAAREVLAAVQADVGVSPTPPPSSSMDESSPDVGVGEGEGGGGESPAVAYLGGIGHDVQAAVGLLREWAGLRHALEHSALMKPSVMGNDGMPRTLSMDGAALEEFLRTCVRLGWGVMDDRVVRFCPRGLLAPEPVGTVRQEIVRVAYAASRAMGDFLTAHPGAVRTLVESIQRGSHGDRCPIIVIDNGRVRYEDCVVWSTMAGLMSEPVVDPAGVGAGHGVAARGGRPAPAPRATIAAPFIAADSMAFSVVTAAGAALGLVGSPPDVSKVSQLCAALRVVAAAVQPPAVRTLGDRWQFVLVAVGAPPEATHPIEWGCRTLLGHALVEALPSVAGANCVGSPDRGPFMLLVRADPGLGGPQAQEAQVRQVELALSFGLQVLVVAKATPLHLFENPRIRAAAVVMKWGEGLGAEEGGCHRPPGALSHLQAALHSVYAGTPDAKRNLGFPLYDVASLHLRPNTAAVTPAHLVAEMLQVGTMGLELVAEGRARLRDVRRVFHAYQAQRGYRFHMTTLVPSHVIEARDLVCAGAGEHPRLVWGPAQDTFLGLVVKDVLETK